MYLTFALKYIISILKREEKDIHITAGIIPSEMWISYFERRSQSDCVHEQVAKADCECPFYWVKLAEMKNTSLQHIVLDSCNEAVLAWRKENKNPAFSCFLQEIQKLL